MKAHKYWSLGALACMAGCFYTGCKLTSISLVALWSAWAWQSTPATKLHLKRKKLKKPKNKNTRPRRNKRGLF